MREIHKMFYTASRARPVHFTVEEWYKIFFRVNPITKKVKPRSSIGAQKVARRIVRANRKAIKRARRQANKGLFKEEE